MSSVKCQERKEKKGLTTPNILLISKDQQQRVLHLAVLDDTLKFVLGLVHTVAVIAVDDEDEALDPRERERKSVSLHVTLKRGARKSPWFRGETGLVGGRGEGRMGQRGRGWIGAWDSFFIGSRRK